MRNEKRRIVRGRRRRHDAAKGGGFQEMTRVNREDRTMREQVERDMEMGERKGRVRRG